MLLKGKNVVITGCNRGIGKAILTDCVKHGADVFAVIRKENHEFEKECEELSEKHGVRIHVIYIDLSDEQQVKEGAKKIMSYKIPIDVIINNAGVSNPLALFQMTRFETIRQTFEVNFFSQLLFTQLLSKSMLRNKRGSIIFLSSSAAFDGGANVDYSASKAAIIGAVKRLAVELGSYGIRVNAIAPGLTDTDMGGGMSEEDEKIALSMNIMHRKGRPEEIADAAVFLGSDMSSFMTGQVLRVDGGLR